MNLAEYLSTHLRYSAWASRRTLQALRRLSEEEFNRNLGASFGSIRGTLEHMFVADRVWFEKLAGEPAGLDEPPTEIAADTPNPEDENAHRDISIYGRIPHMEKLRQSRFVPCRRWREAGPARRPGLI